MSRSTLVSRARAILINRIITGAAVSMALASYFWQPTRLLLYVIDVVVRAYLHFVAGVMAHESVHGHLGNTRRSNEWWGRFGLLPTTVPYVTFRRTHLHHHSDTNIPELDPDEFLNTRHSWQIPFRAFALPYHWVVWLIRNGRFSSRERVEYCLHYVVVTLVYGVIAYLTSIERVLIGLLASATLHSLLLWYCFAIKTHEGYSTGEPETRSHNYNSQLVYWFSFGLSMHQLHHMKPRLAWLQMVRFVPASMEVVNDILRKAIDRFVGLSALLFRMALYVRLMAYSRQQQRLSRRYGIKADTPVCGYDDLRLHAREAAAAYAYTSGSTRTPKRIAYNRLRIRKTLQVFVSAIFRHLAARLPRNRTFFVFSPLRPDRSLTTLLLVDKDLPPYLCGLQAPHRVQQHPAIRGAAGIYGETAVRLWLLTISNPGLIYATNPSTIATFFADIHSNWFESRRLVSDYLVGAPDVPSELPCIYRRIASRGARARMSRIAGSPAPLSPAEMFPGLRSFSCWDGGYVRPFVQQIRHFLPETDYLHLPMYSMSTETIETIRVDSEGSSAFLPLAPGVLYEFITEGNPDQPEYLLRPGQLTEGCRYSLIVSDPHGLRRYQTEDIFECVGKVRELPDLRFIRRRNLSYSFTGEKLTAEQLKLAYQEAENQFPDLRTQGVLTCFPSFSDAESTPCYRLVLVRTSAGNDTLPGDLLTVVEKKLCEFNSEYESKIESRRLGRMTLEVITAGEFIRTLVGANAASESQFKFMPLYPRSWESVVAHD